MGINYFIHNVFIQSLEQHIYSGRIQKILGKNISPGDKNRR